MSSEVFNYDGDELSAESVAISRVARSVPTPFYVYARDTLVERYRQLERAFSGTPHLHCVALKANSQPALLRPLFAQGAGAEVVSGAELGLGLRLTVERA